MDVNPRTPQEIFGLMVRYLVPPFQRSYVWNQEDQWQPLWNDVARTAEALHHKADPEQVERHFFGAVVVQDAPTPTGHVQRKNVIDGDAEVIESATTARLYGVVKQGRIRVVLEAIEDRKRSDKAEIQHCPRQHLQIEHVMPQQWPEHWGVDIADDTDSGQRRDRVVQTLGNLTLVTEKLNPALGNLPWTDDDTRVVHSGRGNPVGKRSQLDKHSMLLLNRQLVRAHPEQWRESDVVERGHELASIVLNIWPRP